MSDGEHSTDDIERFEELATGWENEAHHLKEQGHDESAGAIEACASELRRAIEAGSEQ